MTVRRTASHDATAQTTCVGADDQIFWLRSRGVDAFRAAARAGSSTIFRRMTATVGIGVFLTVSTTSSAFAPASSKKLATETAAAPDDITLPAIETVAFAPIAVEGEKRADVTRNVGGPLEVPAELEHFSRDLDQYKAEPQQTRVQRDPNEVLSFGNTRVPRWLVETILKASEVTGVCPEYMMALADKESSFRQSVKAGTSSAEGLFQFITATWLEVIQDFGAKYGLQNAAAAVETIDGKLAIRDDKMRAWVMNLRRDPYVSALMAAEMLKRDRDRIEAHLGRTLERSEFYLAHFLGVDSARRLMKVRADEPTRSARREFPAAARANKNIFFEKKGRKMRDLSVAEVYDRIDGMIDKRIDRFTNVVEVAEGVDSRL